MKPYFAPFRIQIVSFVLISTMLYCVSLIQPYLMGGFVDQLSAGLRAETIWTYCGIFLLVTMLGVALSYYVKIFGTKIQCQLANQVKSQFFIHFQRTSPRYHLQESASSTADKVNNDVELLMCFFLNLGIQFFGNVLVLVLASCYIFSVDIWCGVAELAFLPLLGLLYHVFEERIFKASQTVAETRSDFFAILEEQFHAVRSIRLHQITNVLKNRFMRIAKIREEVNVDEEKVVFPYSMINQNMDTLLKVFLFAYGGYAVLGGRMTVGQFTILYSYMSLITASFSYFLGLGQQTQQHFAYYTRLKELAEVPEEHNGTQVPQALEEISAENLHFGYDDREILTGLTQKFQKGSIYCLVGKNGAGKSTLATLLLGLYPDDTGESVRYNGVPIRDIDLYKMRETRIGVSEQEPTMLSGSVGFNLTYQEEGPYDTQALALLFETVNFSNGEAHTPQELVSLDAASLSGGQKQKVSIMKALYKNPQLLVLDEPTSALDAASRQRLAKYLRATSGSRITILVSHDPELIDIADEVVTIGNA